MPSSALEMFLQIHAGLRKVFGPYVVWLLFPLWLQSFRGGGIFSMLSLFSSFPFPLYRHFSLNKSMENLSRTTVIHSVHLRFHQLPFLFSVFLFQSIQAWKFSFHEQLIRALHSSVKTKDKTTKGLENRKRFSNKVHRKESSVIFTFG